MYDGYYCIYLCCTCRLLNTAQGSLLDDEKLVNALQSSKSTAIEVQEQLEISEQTEVKIDAAREVRDKVYSVIEYYTVFSNRVLYSIQSCY